MMHATLISEGKYLVPCVRGQLYSLYRWWPVIGPKHEDTAIIDFPYKHYHIDWRFVTDAQIDTLTRFFMPAFSADTARQRIRSLVIRPTQIQDGPELRPRRLLRKESIFPSPSWMTPLEEHHRTARLKNGRCPHKGAVLQPDEGLVRGEIMHTGRSAIQCPLHGLCFAEDTGDMIPRELINFGAVEEECNV